MSSEAVSQPGAVGICNKGRKPARGKGCLNVRILKPPNGFEPDAVGYRALNFMSVSVANRMSLGNAASAPKWLTTHYLGRAGY